VSLDIWLTAQRSVEVFDANFTHNVTPMWRKAGVYEALYESAGLTAGDVLPALRAGLADMLANPAEYMALDAPNKWGTYKDAMPWLAALVVAFEANPDGEIGVSR